MIFKRKFYLSKLNQSTRLCSQKTIQQHKIINEKPQHAAYQPSKIENVDISTKYSKTKPSGTSERFSMIFPPPNVTGNLHIGHTLTATIQDVIIRLKRKQGIETKWIFGTDHAGIATQVVVEKIQQKKSGLTRHIIGRDEFIKEIWKWKNEKKSTISSDLRKLGTAFDWDREYFTLDENLSYAVSEAFIRLHEKELIYRDKSLVNWSCALESTISDVEVENLEISGATHLSIPNYENLVTVGFLTNFAYKFSDSSDEIVVSTTRPETMLGDVAVAVNPNDSRYSHLHGKKLYHPYRMTDIPIIFDESVDSDFGTGAVKITPSHDKNDFEIAKRHKLAHIQVFAENGSIVDGFEKFSGLRRFDARQKILDDLVNLQLFRGTNPHNMILPICSRSKDIIEFMIKPQWFVRSSELSKKAVKAIESGQIKIIPQNFEKEWFRWLNNCRDWCISRQLWWGHEIPAYKFTFGSSNNEIWIAAKSQKEAEQKFMQKHQNVQFTVTKDRDVLDTWFSSGLLPFSLFGWPHENDENLKKYFPLNLMETGHDILFFWVARMVMLSLELTDQVPFKEILLHGVVCDSFGRKMSKSLGNVILPDQIIKGATLDDLRREIESNVDRGILSHTELEKSIQGQKKMFPNGIQECGIDALRFTLCSQNTKQHFINFDVNECIANKLFFNKIWQATKYALNYADSKGISVKDIKTIQIDDLKTMDLWILSRLASTIKSVRQSNDDYNFHLSTAALKTFFYNNFCDVYLETTKNDLKASNSGFSSAIVLNICLSIGLDFLEVFTPYLATELKNFLPENVAFDAERYVNEQLESQVNEMLEICACVREAKSHMKITKKHKCLIMIYVQKVDYEKFLNENLEHIKHLTFSEDVETTTDAEKFEVLEFDQKLTANHMCSFGINLLETRNEHKTDDLIRMKKLKKLEDELENLRVTVSRNGYKEKASEKIQQKHKEKIEKLQLEIKTIRQLSGN